MPFWHYQEALALVALGELDAAGARGEAGLRIAGQLTARQIRACRCSVFSSRSPCFATICAAPTRVCADG